MGGDCCQLVGNLDLGIEGCIISISTNLSTEVVSSCGDEPLEGPSISSVNISAFASSEVWVGCPGKAGVSIPYVRKYDCVNDIVYILFSGQGQSFVAGDVSRYVSLVRSLSTSSPAYSASSSSGPASIYMVTTQINGYGLSYTGEPFSFTTSEEGVIMNLGTLGDNYYLQSFNFDAQPGQIPVVSYSFMKGFVSNNG